MTSASSTPIDALLAEQQWLHDLARHLVRDPEAAADLEQETWLAALRSPPQHDTSPRGWLATVLRRLAQRRVEGERHARGREVDAARGELLPDAGVGAERAETVRALVEATLALEEPFRATVLARWFEGLEPSEIGLRMGVPASTVRTRLVRAHAKLRVALTGRVAEDDLSGLGWLALAGVAWRELRARWVVALPAFVAATLLVVGGARLLLGDGDGPEAVPTIAATAHERAGPVRGDEPDASTATLATEGPSAPVQGTGERVAATAPVATVTGTLSDAQTRPVPHGRVAIWSQADLRAELHTSDGRDEPADGERRVLELATDAEGRFEVPIEYVGERVDGSTPYYVVCETPGYTRDSAPLVRGAPISVQAAHLVRFEGRVVEAGSGAPIAGVQVDCGLGDGRTESGADGRFAIPDMRGYEGVRVELFHPDYVAVAVPISLASREPRVHEFALERGVVLDVQFVDEATGAAVPEVRLHEQSNSPFGPVADASGRVSLHHSPHGPTVWSGEAPGFAAFVWQVPARVEAPDGVLTFPLHALRSLSGTVLDRAGRPVAGAAVTARSLAEERPVHVAGLPGTVTMHATPRHMASPRWRSVRTDVEGRFEVPVAGHEGPWDVSAYHERRRSNGVVVSALDERPELVLADPPESITSFVRGRLVRGGEPWSVRSILALQGSAQAQASSASDGTFALKAVGAGACRLVLHDRVVARFEFDGASRELGDVALDDLPLLRLRCETPDGEALAGAGVWIYPQRQGDAVPDGSRAGSIAVETDSAGRAETLLPHAGDYVAYLGGSTVLAVDTIRVAGDLEHVLRVPRTRTFELRLVDAATRAALVYDFDLEQELASWRRVGDATLWHVRAQPYGDGVLAFALPDVPLELVLRPRLRGYRTVRLDPTRLAAAAQRPLEVALERGRTLEVALAGLERVPEGVRFVWLHETDLSLVRPPLDRAESAALTARGLHTAFFDAHLNDQRLTPDPSGASILLHGLDDGRHTTVAFDEHGRRPDLQLEPVLFEVGPETASVTLTLPPR